jgi:hypothetical protein
VSRICLYNRIAPETDRWLPGDRFVRPAVRRLVRGRPRVGGLNKVLLNLCRGLDAIDTRYVVNLPFREVRPDDRVAVLGRGRYALAGYRLSNPVLAGIGLMTHPSEWPTLFEDYPVSLYLQHSAWTRDVYAPYFGDRCCLWAAGIDTERWRPGAERQKQYDFVIYDKLRWNRDDRVRSLLAPIRRELMRRKLSFVELKYGEYTEERYEDILRRCRAMIFLCEHESQGIAYQECLSAGVPILAWDQGWYLDPERAIWKQADIRATSVPFFDARCGLTFRGVEEFAEKLDIFIDRARSNTLAPRDYVVEELSLEKSAHGFLALLERVYRS